MRISWNKKYFEILISNLGAIILFIIIILVALQVISRYIFRQPLFWTEELARYGLIWLSMVGGAMGVCDKEHIKIETFIHLLKPQKQKLFNIFSDLIIIFVSSILLFHGYSFALLNKSQYSPSMEWMSMFWPFLALPLGGGLILFCVIKNILKNER